MSNANNGIVRFKNDAHVDVWDPNVDYGKLYSVPDPPKSSSHAQIVNKHEVHGTQCKKEKQFF